METLFAGFARVDITPEIGGMPLGGYGSTSRRLAARVLDPIFINAVALKNGEESCVFLTTDLSVIENEWFFLYRDAVHEATGLPKERIFIDTTHSHASADIRSSLPSAEHFRSEEMPRKLAEAARRALADLKPARISYGSIDVGNDGFRLNFNRYYYMTEIEKRNSYKPEDLHSVGDNFGYAYSKHKEKYCYVGHEEEADHSLQLLRFTRDAADDIVIMNFAAHPTITGGLYEPNISADFPGAARDRVEQLLPGTKCTFMQGCAGNINCKTRMEEEGVYGVTFGNQRSHIAYGAILAAHAVQALNENMTESKTQTLFFSRTIHTAERDHSMDDLVPKAEKIVEIYLRDGYTDEVRAMCAEKGFNSAYHALYAVKKSKEPKTGSFEMNAIRIGDCAVVTSPHELFSATGQHIKEASPFALTLVNAYSCGYECYLPSKDSTPDAYEANIAYYARGTAEDMEKIYQNMLLDLKQKKD